MRQDFSKVTAEELAKLFPIILVKHNPAWKDYYLQEKEFLQSIFGDQLIRINHIGSSSVPGLIAKPTVDILLEISEATDLQRITEIMLDEGYVINHPEGDLIMYLKGYTLQGFQGQAVHIHIRHSGDWGELYFRDYLLSHPETAAEYAGLKLALREQYTHDRNGYTQAKGAFVQKYTGQARSEYAGRYTPAL